MLQTEIMHSASSLLHTGSMINPTRSLDLSDHTLAGRTILQILPALHSGGAERTCVDIAAALASEGARGLVAASGGRLVSELQAKGGLWAPFPAATKNPIEIMLNISRLTQILKMEQVNLIHARSRAPAWASYYAARRVGIKFVTTYHSSYAASSPIKLQYNSIMASGDMIIANSHYMARRIKELYPAAQDRVTVIPRGIDLSLFCPQQIEPARVQRLRDQWDVAPHERILLMPARLSARKGFETLIDAIKLLLSRGLAKDLRVILAGDAHSKSFRKTLEAQLMREDLASFVRCVGHCEDMPAAYLAAACVVAPAIVPEAFGRVGVEAQAMGAPVIISDIGAASEIIPGSSRPPAQMATGWRVPPGNAEALASAIEEALSMRASARQSLAHYAREHVHKNFSIEKMQRATLDVYRSLLKNF